jgi:hypothetical protein
MKKIIAIMLLAACSTAGFAQQDSTNQKKGTDTIRVGTLLIVTGGSSSGNTVHMGKTYTKRNVRKSNITTNWLIFDIGYSGFNDRTNYAGAEAQQFLKNPVGGPLYAGDFSIKGIGISNFSLWFFMQKLNIYKHVINLKYGFGIENNNYYYKTPITYLDGGTVYVKRDNVLFSKNKLAADYFTAPLMLNINPMPNARKGGIQLSVGVSGGFLYSARQKQKSDERGKQKEKTDFNLERWKLAYVAELGLGPVKLFGSYAFTPLHRYGVEQYPYNVGIRLSAGDW